ncbi:MAG: TetR/AcrR family transcriptional regulator, partial [Hyphomicrobiales bacterium]|nr:TetR/AcrR family transcriptional regulator [Hyphomicrobiales bacterium]
METEAAPGERVFSPRQAEVLEAALRELVEGGRPLTMGAVAKRAACSKETLY